MENFSGSLKSRLSTIPHRPQAHRDRQCNYENIYTIILHCSRTQAPGAVVIRIRPAIALSGGRGERSTAPGQPGAVLAEMVRDRRLVESEVRELIAVDPMLMSRVRGQPSSGAGLVLGAEPVAEVPADVAHRVDRRGDQPVICDVEEPRRV